MVENLIQKIKADVNFTDNLHRSPLMHALDVASTDSDASFEMEALLIDSGARINDRDIYGKNALHYAFVKFDKN